MMIEDYISEGGAHIQVFDDSLDNSDENREKTYNNLSRIISHIAYENYLKKRKEKTII